LKSKGRINGVVLLKAIERQYQLTIENIWLKKDNDKIDGSLEYVLKRSS
jgi:hypothetical protein